MYADRYARRTKFDPGSMGLALALNGTIVIGLIAFAAPHFVPSIDKPLVLVPIALKPLPPEIKPPPPPKTHDPELPSPTRIDTVPPTVPAPPQGPIFTPDPQPPISDSGTFGGGTFEPVKPMPVVIGPIRDARYAAGFQPEYPASERRAGHHGRVVVRVLVGVDGRVKRVEKVSAASDAFFEVTERRALDKWRFKPGTRDGVPIEAWQTVSLSFVLNDE